MPRVTISASAYGTSGTMPDVDALQPGGRSLEVAVVDGQHHGPAAVRAEDPRQPMLHTPVVGG